jgi:hypothetical protein
MNNDNHTPNIFDFEIHGFRLTVAGMVELSCFSHEAIAYAKNLVMQPDKKSLKDPFRFLYAKAREYSISKGIPINSGLVSDTRKTLSLKDGDAKLICVRGNVCAENGEKSYLSLRGSPCDIQEDNLSSNFGGPGGANSPLETDRSGKESKSSSQNPKQIIKVFYSPEQVELNVRTIENTPFFRSLNYGQSPRERFAEELKNGEWVSRTREEWERHEAAMKKHNATFSAFEEKIAGDQQWKRERGYKQDFATSTEEESFTKTEMATPQVELSAHVPVVGVLKKVNSEEVYEYEGIDSDFYGIDSVDQIDIFGDSLPKALGAKEMRYGVHSPYI